MEERRQKRHPVPEELSKLVRSKEISRAVLSFVSNYPNLTKVASLYAELHWNPGMSPGECYRRLADHLEYMMTEAVEEEYGRGEDFDIAEIITKTLREEFARHDWAGVLANSVEHGMIALPNLPVTN